MSWLFSSFRRSLLSRCVFGSIEEKVFKEVGVLFVSKGLVEWSQRDLWRVVVNRSDLGSVLARMHLNSFEYEDKQNTPDQHLRIPNQGISVISVTVVLFEEILREE